MVAVVGGKSFVRCMLINNRFRYTDSVDDEDLCELPEIRRLLDMLCSAEKLGVPEVVSLESTWMFSRSQG